jgi:hypothetical protein
VFGGIHVWINKQTFEPSLVPDAAGVTTGGAAAKASPRAGSVGRCSEASYGWLSNNAYRPFAFSHMILII